MRSGKEIYWNPARQAHLEEARRVLGTESDSETVARALELIATRGVPAVDPEKIKLSHITANCSTIDMGHHHVGWIDQTYETTIVRLKDGRKIDIGRHSLATDKPASGVPGRAACKERIAEILLMG